MLEACMEKPLAFEDSCRRNPAFEVMHPKVEIQDAMSVRFTAQFVGPPGTQVIGRAWISDEDGTIVDGETGEVAAGTEQEIVLSIPGKRPQNGNLIACMRVEWPTYQTKHVIQCTLIEGGLIHPPRGKPC